MQRAERMGGAARLPREMAEGAKHRIALVAIQTPSLVDEDGACRLTEQIGNRNATSRAEVDDTALRGAPWLSIGGLDVDVVFI
jgi:hypothetical protein